MQRNKYAVTMHDISSFETFTSKREAFCFAKERQRMWRLVLRALVLDLRRAALFRKKEHLTPVRTVLG